MSEASDCNETLRELEAFLDQELTTDTKQAIDRHLGGCNHCLEAFDFHAELKLVIQQKCHSDEFPPGLMARIERCLDADIDGDGRIG
jgi:anti-sigma factor (TIGR02949 family)